MEDGVLRSCRLEQELLAIVDEFLRPDIDALCNISLSSFRTEWLQTLSETIYDMEKDFKSNLDNNQFEAFHGFFDNIGKQRRGIEVAIKEATMSLGANLRYTYTSPISEKS